MAGFFSGDARADLHASCCTVGQGPRAARAEEEVQPACPVVALHGTIALSHPGPPVGQQTRLGAHCCEGLQLAVSAAHDASQTGVDEMNRVS